MIDLTTKQRRGGRPKSEIMAERRAAARDITDNFEHGFDGAGCPLPEDPERRAQYRDDLLGFMSFYFPAMFYLPWSDNQKAEIQQAETVIQNGGNYAFAAPRGDGKTSRVQAYVLYSILYGWRRFPVIVGADQRAANEIFEAVKTELRVNERLRADFPEVCIPAMIAEDTAQRARVLTLHGTPLAFQWGRKILILPTIEGAESSGAVIVPCGLTGRLRGLQHKTETGENIRPDLLLIDDGSTDESAASPTQNDTREKLVLGAVKGSGGPVQSVAAFMPGTVIQPHDLMHRFLDRKRHPDWHGTRTMLVQKWPTNSKLWERYAEIWRDAQTEGDVTFAKATEFYRNNRAEMDAGAEVSNQHRVAPHCESALQTAYNLQLENGEDVFEAEYQNTPRTAQTTSTTYEINPAKVAAKINNLDRFTAPDDAEFITVGIDLNPQTSGVNWLAAAYSQMRAGHVLSYGVYPAGDRVLYDPKNSTQTLEQALFEGLQSVIGQIEETQFQRGGAPASPDLVLIDCGGTWMDTVFQFIRAYNGALKLCASRGRAAKQYKQTRVVGHPGDAVHQTRWNNKGLVMIHNSDAWRMRTQKGFLLPPGAPGSLSLYGTDPNLHRWLANQICAERLAEHVVTDVAEFFDWRVKPGESNDQLDALVMSNAGAGLLGASPVATEKRKKKPRIITKNNNKYLFPGANGNYGKWSI